MATMKIEAQFTDRGFLELSFQDNYGDAPLSIQESSDVDPHLWIGVRNPQILRLVKYTGWVPVEQPSGTMISSRAHINPETARVIAAVLLAWADDADSSLAAAAKQVGIEVPGA